MMLKGFINGDSNQGLRQVGKHQEMHRTIIQNSYYTAQINH